MAYEQDVKIAQRLQPIARNIDAMLKDAAGDKVNFSLFVWGEGRAQYISNADRKDVIKALEETLERWRQGQPDVLPQDVN